MTNHDINGMPLDFGTVEGGATLNQPPSPPRLPHCAVRAQERYGITLTRRDVEDIAKRCMAGEGKAETKPDGTQYHVLIVGDRVLWLVYRAPSAGGPRPFGTVITVMPPSVANTRIWRDLQFKNRRVRSRK
jgi:hypothetical protein